MLCPFCLKEVELFEPSDDGQPGLTCPSCKSSNIPVLYPRDYASHPGIPVALIGPSGHGKTAYIESLINHLEERIVWPGFGCTWVDQIGMMNSRLRLRALREFGEMPDFTNVVFPEPQVIRLKKVPRIGGCQLVFYDTSGEVFSDTESFRVAGRYVASCKVVIWLVSLTDLEHRLQLCDLLTVYNQTVVTMGGDPREQTIILVLTKGDKLCGTNEDHQHLRLPKAAQDLLMNDDLNPAGDAWTRLSEVSHTIEKWLPTVGQRNLTNLLIDEFKAVHFCVVSALGSTPPTDGEKTPFQPAPKGVLAPIFWLWRELLAAVEVETNGRKELFFDLAEAIAAAAPGTTIRIGAGVSTLPGRVEIFKPVTIVGAGIDKTVIQCAARQRVFGIKLGDGQVVCLKGLTIEHVGAEPADVIVIVQGKIIIEQCVLRGGIPGTKPNDGFGNGLIAARTADAHLTGCSMIGNRGSGLSTRDATRISGDNCTFADNARSGIDISGTSAMFRSSLFRGNRMHGVRAAAKCEVALRDKCTIESNSSNGVHAVDDVRLIIDDCRLIANGIDPVIPKDGVVMKDRVVAILTGNKFSQSGQAGISVQNQVSGRIEGNECFDNRLDGIDVEDEALIEVTGNQCRGNLRAGIRYNANSRGVCRGNTCNGNRETGIEVAGNAAPELSDNGCHKTTRGPGFRVAEAGFSNFLEGNVASENGDGDLDPPDLGAPAPPPLEHRPKKKSWW